MAYLKVSPITRLFLLLLVLLNFSGETLAQQFVLAELEGKSLAIQNDVEEGYAPLNRSALILQADGQGFESNSILPIANSLELFTYSVVDGDLVIVSESESILFFDYDFVVNQYGQATADELQTLIDAGTISSQIELKRVSTKVYEMVNETTDYIDTQVVTTIVEELMLGEVAFQANRVSTTTVDPFARRLITDLNKTSELFTENMFNGVWAIPLDYGLPQAFADSDEYGLFADQVTFFTDGTGVGEISEQTFTWSLSSDGLLIQYSNLNVLLRPYARTENVYEASVKVFTPSQTFYEHVAPMVRFSGSYTQFTDNLVTPFPLAWNNDINGSSSTCWDNGDRVLEPNSACLFSHNFLDDGTVYFGTFDTYDAENDQISFNTQGRGTYYLEANKLIVNRTIRSQRQHYILSSNPSGKVYVIESNTRRKNFAIRAAIDDTSDVGYFIFPRVSVITQVDLSQFEGAYAASTFPGDLAEKNAAPAFQGVDIGYTPIVLDSDNFEARAVQSIDLDKDGDIDTVVIGKAEGVIDWFENNGDGTVTQQTLIDSGALGLNSMHVVDVNLDGHLDIAFTHLGLGTVELYINNGSQVFSQSVLASNLSFPRDLKVVDIDADNDLDLVFIDFIDDSILWIESTGDATYSDIQAIDDNTDTPVRMDIVDINDDGLLDIVGTNKNRDNSLVWYENQGDKTFVKIELALASTSLSDVLGVDVDADGDMDIVVADGINPTPGSGATPNTVYLFTNDGSQNFTQSVLSTEGRQANHLVSGDLDNDSDLDLVVTSGNYGVGVLTQSDITEFERSILATDNDAGLESTIVDYNYDGYQDIVSVSPSTLDNVTLFTASPSLTLKVAENTRRVGRVTAVDPEGESITYSLGGVDAEYFDINPPTGLIVFRSAPDFESPQGGTSTYIITVTANDGSKDATINIVIEVEDVEDESIDSDNDGMSDEYETANGLDASNPNDANLDSDGDGLTNLEEFNIGTLAQVADSDGDGILDGFDSAPLNDMMGVLAFLDSDSDNNEDKVLVDGATIKLFEASSGTVASQIATPTWLNAEQAVALPDSNGDATWDVLVLGKTPSNNILFELYSGRDSSRLYRHAYPGWMQVNMHKAVSTLSDINSNQRNEIGLLIERNDGRELFVVYDSGTYALLNAILLPGWFDTNEMFVLSDWTGNGAVEIAFYGQTSGGIETFLKYDSLSGAFLGQARIPTWYTAREIALGSDTNNNGVEELILLGNAAGSSWISLDGRSGALVRSQLFPGWISTSNLTVIDDQGGDGIKDVLVLGSTPADTQLYLRRDGLARFGVVPKAMPGWFTPEDITTVSDLNGNDTTDILIKGTTPLGTEVWLRREGTDGSDLGQVVVQ